MTAEELAEEVRNRILEQAKYIAQLECELDDLREQVLNNDISTKYVAKMEK